MAEADGGQQCSPLVVEGVEVVEEEIELVEWVENTDMGDMEDILYYLLHHHLDKILQRSFLLLFCNLH